MSGKARNSSSQSLNLLRMLLVYVSELGTYCLSFHAELDSVSNHPDSLTVEQRGFWCCGDGQISRAVGQIEI